MIYKACAKWCEATRNGNIHQVVETFNVNFSSLNSNTGSQVGKCKSKHLLILHTSVPIDAILRGKVDLKDAKALLVPFGFV